MEEVYSRSKDDINQVLWRKVWHLDINLPEVEQEDQRSNSKQLFEVDNLFDLQFDLIRQRTVGAPSLDQIDKLLR